LSGRSDLHCYFWPAATRLLKPDGYFGFLTSSSWLDVEYGFALQGWLLRNFRILAIMESAAEPWFEDARVKTCVTILQRCDDDAQRMANRVRFVRFNSKLADIIGVPAAPENEDARQAALQDLRERILGAEADRQDKDLRIIVKTQRELWQDGVRAGTILGDLWEARSPNDSEGGGATYPDPPSTGAIWRIREGPPEEYRAGKWGQYLRAPDLYFDIMGRFGSRFVALGEIAGVRFGVKSGCDAFFMPKDITSAMLEAHKDDLDFRRRAGGASRKDAASGKLKIVLAGDGSLHPIEAKYLAPEVHSLMNVDRPIVRAAHLDRVVLLVGEPMYKLKTRAPWVWRYLQYGMTAQFPSGRSKRVPVPKRSTCAAREPWYDLTNLVRPGMAFWPMAQQYRHIIAANPERLICNHNLFDLSQAALSDRESASLVAVLNSTLVGLFKTFYGRYAGTEGNLKTEVVDVNLLQVPDPRGVSTKVAGRLIKSLKRMTEREVGRLVEEQLMDCHNPDRARRIAAGPIVLSNELQQPDRRALDDAVFELLGVDDLQERAALIARLYEATARHFRDIRVVEIQKMQQRAKSDNHEFKVHNLAEDIWDAAAIEDAMTLTEWIGQRPESDSLVIIPEERPAVLSQEVMFTPNTVYFGKPRKAHVDCQSRGQAELITLVANLGISGEVRTPSKLQSSIKLLDRINVRLERARARFRELAESRTSDERVQDQLLELLERWFVLGRTAERPVAPPETDAETPDQ